MTAKPETQTATIRGATFVGTADRVHAAQNPLRNQLCKYLKVRGHEVRGSAAHKQVFDEPGSVPDG